MAAYDDCELSDGVSYEMLQENEFTRQIPSYTNGFVRLLPNNQVTEKWDGFYKIKRILPFQVFPKCFLRYQKRLKDFQCRDGDIWVASFPKCGMV